MSSVLVTDDLSDEVARLREMLAAHEDLARKHAALLVRLAELEAADTHRKRGRRFLAEDLLKERESARGTGAGRQPQGARVSPVSESEAEAVQAFVSRLSGGSHSILIIGSPRTDENAWRASGAFEMADIVHGLSEDANPLILLGNSVSSAAKDLSSLEKRFGVTAAQFGFSGKLTSNLWRHLVSEVSAAVKPGAVIFLDASPLQCGAIRDVSRKFDNVIVCCFRNEIATLEGAPEIGAEGALQGALGAARLVLVSSEWERLRVAALFGDKRVEVFRRGVNLTRYRATLPVGRSGNRVLFVVDRTGREGVHAVLSAAHHLADTTSLHFDIVSAGMAFAGRNVSDLPFPPTANRPMLFQSADLVIVPPDCSGVSQTMMEAMAAGCACLAPERSFSQEADLLPALLMYSEERPLVSVLAQMAADPRRVSEIGQAAAQLATRVLPRTLWRERFRQALASAQVDVGRGPDRDERLA